MNPPIRRGASLRIGAHRFQWGQRTYLMGVLNVTPDSFSGDGVANDPAARRRRIAQLAVEQPDIIDVGAESTRPGARAVAEREELARVLPAIEDLRVVTDLPISIDTRKAEVARRALAAGADAINDVSGGAHDPEILEVAAEAGVPFVLTHNRRAQAVTSRLGGHYAGVEYADLVRDILDDVETLLAHARRAGVSRNHIIFDPGFGFGKTPDQSLELLRRLSEFRVLGLPMLVGMSRKSFVGHVLDLSIDDRLEGSLAAATVAVAHGADLVRAHDVAATRRATALADAIYRSA